MSQKIFARVIKIISRSGRESHAREIISCATDNVEVSSRDRVSEVVIRNNYPPSYTATGHNPHLSARKRLYKRPT